MVTKRIKGLLGQIAAGVQPKDTWEDIQAPSHYVLGPIQSGVSYIPGITLMVPLAAGGSSDLAFAVQNPFAADVHIRSMQLDIRTAGQSSASIDIGLVASSISTDTDIVSSASLAEALILPVITGGWDTRWKKNGSTANAWLTGKIKVDGATGLVGDLIIEALPLFTL